MDTGLSKATESLSAVTVSFSLEKQDENLKSVVLLSWTQQSGPQNPLHAADVVDVYPSC